MNIDKDNYEEYFLLFADNELSEQEKNMVEAFIKLHPALEEEFLNIKQSVLKPESELTLEDKNALFRHTKKFISYINYQEGFIQYNDNELTSQQRKETETFLLENPSLQNEFELLQKAKLQPDNSDVFPGKELLYRRKEKGKVISFNWWKALAAAVLLGLGTWIGVDYQNKSVEHPTVKEPSLVKNTIVEKPVKTVLTPTVPTAPINKQEDPVAVKNPEKHSSKQRSNLPKRTDKLPLKSNDAGDLAVRKEKQTNNLPEVYTIRGKTDNQPLNNISKNVPKNNDDNVVKGKNKVEKNDDKEVKQDQLANVGKLTEALNTSYSADESEDNDNYAFLNISQERFNKSKVGGFLRKVKRIIERKISPLSSSKSQREVAAN